MTEEDIEDPILAALDQDDDEDVDWDDSGDGLDSEDDKDDEDAHFRRLVDAG